MKVYQNYNQFPKADWHWPNFSPREMASKREGELGIDPPSMDKLQALRDKLKRPLLITSAYRSAAHNKAVGGAKNSQHRLGKAFDVIMSNQDPVEFEKAAREVGFTGFGYYPKQNFMHIDTGPARSWGTKFPVTASHLAPEPVVPASGVKSADGAAAVGAGAAGVLAVSVDHLPVAGAFFGVLTPVAQTIAVVAAIAFLGFIIWRKRS